MSKRLNNIPVSKIINKKYFWKNEFYVNYDVLDPRPETELIIEEALNNIGDRNTKLKILDIGTGSGCIAISLANELPNSKITAIDISKKALEVANKNIFLNNLEDQIELKHANFSDIKQSFDIIVSNPPYIKEDDYNNLSVSIKKYEPKKALLAGNDGLKFYKIFAKNIEMLLNKNSFFICEIGKGQLNDCISIFKHTKLKLKKISKDIQKIDRTLTFLKI